MEKIKALIRNIVKEELESTTSQEIKVGDKIKDNNEDVYIINIDPKTNMVEVETENGDNSYEGDAKSFDLCFKDGKLYKKNDINELARISEKVKIGDKAKADKIKKLYANAGAFKWIADIIEVIEKAGEDGIARMDAIDALHKEYKQNKTQQEINPKLKDLIDSGVLLSAGLSQPKAEKNVGGAKGRPTSEKTQIARQVDAKLQADKEYQATEDELSALGADFIEKLRKRVKGELKRGRPSKPKDVMENENSKRKLEDKGFKSNPPRYIYLGTNPGGGFSYYFYPETKGMETFKGSIENGNHMSYPDVKKFFETTEPIDSAKKLLQNIGVN